MRRLSLVILFLIFFQSLSVNAAEVYSEGGKFGLKNGSEIITDAKYKKLVRLGEHGWIAQGATKFGIINDEGEVLIEPTFSKAERVLGKFAKLSKAGRYGIYDETGNEILPVEYSSIDLLYGGMFVTCKNYRYGISDMQGKTILQNVFDDIYMPDRNTMILVYNGEIIETKRDENMDMPALYDLQSIEKDLNVIKLNDIALNPIASTGYYGVSATDYILKLVSSISPAYEETIDELMFSQGADTVSILMKFGWIPKFPFVYAQKYYENIVDPNNGPLSKIKRSLKKHAKN